MSRRFETPEFSDAQREQRYVRGTHSDEYRLAQDVVLGYLTTRHAINPNEMTKPHDTFDPHLFLDLVVDRLSREPIRTQMECNQVVDPLLRAVHRWGEHHISLDFSGYEADPGIGNSIEASRDTPLHLRLQLPPFAKNNANAGGNSRYLILTVESERRFRGNFGRNGVECTYHLSHPPFWVGTGMSNNFYIDHVGEEFFIKHNAADDNFGFTLRYGKMGRIDANMGIEWGFFDHNNHIHVPDGAGGWQEVRPE